MKLKNAWNIFYTAYRAGDTTKGEIAGNDYEGRIWRARSVTLAVMELPALCRYGHCIRAGCRFATLGRAAGHCIF
jgi:hypothetical protein